MSVHLQWMPTEAEAAFHTEVSTFTDLLYGLWHIQVKTLSVLISGPEWGAGSSAVNQQLMEYELLILYSF